MPDRDKNRGSLVDASGVTLAVIDPIPYVVELVKENPQADDIWKRWLNTNFEYLIGLTRFVSVEDWTQATGFGTGWANFGSPYSNASYMLDPFGFVHLKGLVKRTTGTVADIFTLPEGYRPPEQVFFTHGGNGAHAEIVITTAGVVTLSVGNPTTYLGLDGITFRI